ncbi:hypothetical protein BH09SUM1_BH09SUM1_19730 [soil metagenome]
MVKKFVAGCLCAVMIGAVCGNAMGEPLDFANRPLLFSGKKPSAQSAQGFVYPFDLSGKGITPHGTPLAALISGATLATRPELFLNGERVDFDPTPRGEGLVFRLQDGPMKQSGNELEVRMPDGSAPSGVAVFALIDSFDDMHFAQAFGEATDFQKTQPTPHSSQANYDVQHYDLSLTLSMTSSPITVNGTVIMTAKALLNNMTQAALDFDANGGLMTISAVTDASLTPLVYTQSGDFLIVTIPATATNSNFTIRVVYSGTPATDGKFGAPYVVSTHGSSVPVVYTFSEPYGARKWWPCKDLPDDKATADIHVIAPKPYSVVSNGTLATTDDLGSTQRFNWTAPFQMPTYLLAVYCTNYAFTSGVYTSQDLSKTMTVGHYYYPESSQVGRVPGTLNAVNFMSQTFGEYPFIDYKYTTVAYNSGSGMEHATCTGMPFSETAEATGEGRRNVHELAHHWFGDYVTCQSFDHVWLNEGFATYCEALFYEDRDGFAAYASYVNGWLSTPISSSAILISTSSDSFSQGNVYKKGGYVLHMLRHVVGKTNLINGMKRYLQSRANSTAVTDDFKAAMETETGLDLSYFFTEWCTRSNWPSYSYSWSQTGSTLHVTITQTQTAAAYTMPIDVRVTDMSAATQTFIALNNQKAAQTFDFDLGTATADAVSIDPDNWILKGTVTETSKAPQPVAKTLIGGTSNATVTWAAASTGTTNGFQVFLSMDGTIFTTVADETTLNGSATSYVIPGLSDGQTYYVKVRATATGLLASLYTDVLAVRLAPGSSKALIVDGYDRWDSTTGRGLNASGHPFVGTHAASIGSRNVAIDSCANEAVTAGTVVLGSYEAAFWVLGEESTTDETFSSTERTLVSAYLNAGGKLFASGAEIGWDLDSQGSTNDRAFYNNYLKSDFVDDDSGDYSVSGVLGGLFDGTSFSYDDGTHGIYFADFPDVVTGFGGGVVDLEYSPGIGAGVEFSGMFPLGVTPGKVVCLGFGFETIYPEATRDDVMQRVISFFGLNTGAEASVESFLTY